MTDDQEHTEARAPQQNVSTGPDDATAIVDQATTQAPEAPRPHREVAVEAAATLLSARTVIKERFQLESMLGAGGMGTVYKARDLRKVEARDRDPWVAIKLLNEGFREHPSALIALQREARKSQTLTHPNIVKVFDFDRDGDRVYLTMELLRGRDLYQYISANPTGVGLSEARRLAGQMGDALQHAHEAGIVHADFTPRNVFLTSEGTAKVLDFGIAQAMVDADTGESSSDGTVFNPASLGGLTPGYASLQRLDGEEPVPADDIYGLGCIIYELLSGEHPTRYRTIREAAQQNLQPRRIDKLPRRQWHALQKAMAVSREERYAGVEEFLDDFMPRSRTANRYLGIAAGVILALAVTAAWQTYQALDGKRASEAQLAARQQSLAESQQRLREEREQVTKQARAELDRVNGEYLDAAARLIESRQFDEADVFLERVQDVAPDHPRLADLQGVLAAARLANEQQRQATASTRSEIERLLAAVDQGIAEGRLVRPRENSAYEAYREIIELEPGNPEARRALVRLVRLQVDAVASALRSGRLEAAGDGLDDLASLAPDDPNLARLRTDYQQAVALQRQRAELVQSMLARAAGLTGEEQLEERRDVYLEVLSIEPGNASARAGLRRTRDEIASQTEQVQREAGALLAQARALLARRPHEVANLQQAHAHLLQAQGLGSGLAGIGELLAQMPDLYATAIEDSVAAGDYQQADELAQAALLLAPRDPELNRLRDEVMQRLAQEERPVIPASF